MLFRGYCNLIAFFATIIALNPMIRRIKKIVRSFLENERVRDARRFAASLEEFQAYGGVSFSERSPLEEFFDARTTGPGIWKWRHYFDVYDRYLRPFRGQAVHFMEIGVYSGGSLDMWQSYFGDQCQILGVDIEAACRQYERPGVSILIGDQSDRQFWREALKDRPPFHAVLDDGGHQTHQQVPTFEEVFPHLAPGAVYICEDVHHAGNGFFTYMSALADQLNAGRISRNPTGTHAEASPAAKWIRAIHFYPYMVVVERNQRPVERLVSEKHGTKWQPFLE